LPENTDFEEVGKTIKVKTIFWFLIILPFGFIRANQWNPVRQAKPGLPCRLKGVYHVNSLFNM